MRRPDEARDAAAIEVERGDGSADDSAPEAEISTTDPTEVKLKGRRIHLSEDVHFRLRMTAYERGRKIGEIADEILDKALPRWECNQVG